MTKNLLILSLTIIFLSFTSLETVDSRNLKNLLDKITVNDTLFVKSAMEGCWGGSHEKVKIYKTTNLFFASFYKSFYDSTFVVQMSKSSIKHYNLLENKMKSFVDSKEYRCTSTYTFEIILNKDSVKIVDYDCAFKEYNSFIANTFIFPKE